MTGELTTPTRSAGTVKWFNEAKGFGFIARDDGRPDCLVHRFDLRDGLENLVAGDRVVFAIVEREKGPWVEGVARLAPDPIAVAIAMRSRPISPGDDTTQQRADEERADDDGMALSVARPPGSGRR
jgi:cold shock protein